MSSERRMDGIGEVAVTILLCRFLVERSTSSDDPVHSHEQGCSGKDDQQDPACPTNCLYSPEPATQAVWP